MQHEASMAITALLRTLAEQLADMTKRN